MLFRQCAVSAVRSTRPLRLPGAHIAVHSYAEACYFGAEGAPSDPAKPARRPFIVGVAGGTASGKSSVCAKIVERLQADDTLTHRGVLSISQDCFYKDLSAEQRRAIGSYNFDHPDAFDFDLICDTLRALRQGQSVQIPIYDFVTSARCAATTTVVTTDVILFDGILALSSPDVRNLFDLKIFVDTDDDTRLARRLRRDIAQRGRDVLAVLEQYERTVKPSFDSYIAPSKKYADLIIPRGAENVVAIDLLCQNIRFRLRQQQEASSP